MDYVLSNKKKTIALEVKSNTKKTALPGIIAFSKQFETSKSMLISGQGMPFEEFFMMRTEDLLK